MDFRRCLGRFATGVTVISCVAPDGTHCGITANSFSSVSLEPPLVLWNIAKVSRSVDALINADFFGINVLTAEQQSVSVHFARSKGDLFRSVPHALSARGVPRLSGTLAWFECRTWATHDCGDHFIVIGEVLDYEPGNGDPLLFYGGRYRQLDGE